MCWKGCESRDLAAELAHTAEPCGSDVNGEQTKTSVACTPEAAPERYGADAGGVSGFVHRRWFLGEESLAVKLASWTAARALRLRAPRACSAVGVHW